MASSTINSVLLHHVEQQPWEGKQQLFLQPVCPKPHLPVTPSMIRWYLLHQAVIQSHTGSAGGFSWCLFFWDSPAFALCLPNHHLFLEEPFLAFDPRTLRLVHHHRAKRHRRSPKNRKRIELTLLFALQVQEPVSSLSKSIIRNPGITR